MRIAGKHTPLPWTRGWGNWIYQGERPPAGEDNPRLIATCEPSTRTMADWEETFANATLIVRAVNCHADLLSALEDCVTELEAELENDPEATLIESVLVSARAAIAKARRDT